MTHVKITWRDSHAWSSGWMTVEEALKKTKNVEPITSTGYVLDEDGEYITIAQNVSKDNVSMLYKIPKKAIIEME